MQYHLMRGLWAGSWSVKKGVRKSVGKFEEGWCGEGETPVLQLSCCSLTCTPINAPSINANNLCLNVLPCLSMFFIWYKFKLPKLDSGITTTRYKTTLKKVRNCKRTKQQRNWRKTLFYDRWSTTKSGAKSKIYLM